MWRHKIQSKQRKLFLVFAILIVSLIVGGFFLLDTLSTRETAETSKPTKSLVFDQSVSTEEKELLDTALAEEIKHVTGEVTVRAEFTTVYPETALLDAYVPVTNRSNATQSIDAEGLKQKQLFVLSGTDSVIRSSLAQTAGIPDDQVRELSQLSAINTEDIAFIPISKLSPDVKLLALDGSYYLESFRVGALFRHALFAVDSVEHTFDIVLTQTPQKDDVLSIRQTGVTALTRVMMTKLQSIGDPLYFSSNISEFLAAADITHVSNEVSFKEGCTVDYSVFCSDPRFIETLKASGVDVVELTGNHNNDVGSEYNTETIKRYHELGWATFGGGLTSEEARKPFLVDQKQSKIAFLGYNYADSPGGGAIARSDSAGANAYDASRIAEDIKQARADADFVIVDVQYWECYSYPDGYVEYPTCDKPIGEQASVFKELIDAGADMVVGTQAHQPQTFEWYNGKPIYYGLGNLYFDQTQWPGTERGIILTHYFFKGRLMQTQLSPTKYDTALQTSLMSEPDAVMLLERLRQAR